MAVGCAITSLVKIGQLSGDMCFSITKICSWKRTVERQKCSQNSIVIVVKFEFIFV